MTSVYATTSAGRCSTASDGHHVRTAQHAHRADAPRYTGPIARSRGSCATTFDRYANTAGSITGRCVAKRCRSSSPIKPRRCMAATVSSSPAKRANRPTKSAGCSPGAQSANMCSLCAFAVAQRYQAGSPLIMLTTLLLVASVWNGCYAHSKTA